MRNFALLFAGVMLRLQAPLRDMAFGFEIGYLIVAWSSWVPKLLVAAWIVRRRQPAIDRLDKHNQRTQSFAASAS